VYFSSFYNQNTCISHLKRRFCPLLFFLTEDRCMIWDSVLFVFVVFVEPSSAATAAAMEDSAAPPATAAPPIVSNQGWR
jgi:hypothetical protein